MSSLVNGFNSILYAYRSGVWKPFVCSRSISLNVSTETIETSAKGTGNWVTAVPTKDSWSGNGDGLVALNSTDLTLADLRQAQIAHERLRIRFQRTAMDGTVYTDQGYGYITLTSDVSSFDNVATFNFSFQGTGPLEQIFTPVGGGGNVQRYVYTGIGGEEFFIEPLLIGKDILSVDKDGIGRADIITVGDPDPATKEVLYVSATGEFKYAQPFEANEKSVILFQDL